MMPQNIFAQRALGTPMAATPSVMQQMRPQAASPVNTAMPVMQRPQLSVPQLPPSTVAPHSTAMPVAQNAMQRFAMPGQINGAPAAQLPPQMVNAMRMRMGM